LLLVVAADTYQNQRERMVREQIEARGVRDRRVLQAMRKVPRHRFVPESQVSRAYQGRPLPIGHDQTISQPYIVALMTELVKPRPGKRVLEIGTGSGYQAAVLAEIVDRVYTIEIVPELGRTSAERLARLGYENIEVRIGDGYQGWKEQAPFDAIIVTAASEQIPPPLIEQLAEGGLMVIPVGSHHFTQTLMSVEKRQGRTRTLEIIPVRFVPFKRGR
jgi:protein-L-isoaspartate(D-aspartate) O-methyltransferase